MPDLAGQYGMRRMVSRESVVFTLCSQLGRHLRHDMLNQELDLDCRVCYSTTTTYILKASLT